MKISLCQKIIVSAETICYLRKYGAPFFDGDSHVSGRKIWINFETHQGFILLINPCLQEMRWFETIFEMFGRASFEAVEVLKLNFEILTSKKKFLNFDGLQSWSKSSFQTLVDCPFFLVSITISISKMQFTSVYCSAMREDRNSVKKSNLCTGSVPT